MMGRKNILLIELIVVLFFFAISTVITVQVFYEASRQSKESIRTTCALADIESWAERIAISSDIDSLIAEWDTPESAGEFRLDCEGGYFLTMKYEKEETSSGLVLRFTFSAYDAQYEGSPLLVSLPIVHYIPGSGETA